MVVFYLVFCSARWIGIHGFSIGIDDVQPGVVLEQRKKDEIGDGYKACNKKIEDFRQGNLQLKSGLDAAKSLEAEITGILNKIREDTGTVKT